MKFKPIKILFFVDGMAPTNEDILAASQINAHVVFRNARVVPAEGCLEACDGVAGKVPPRYAAAYPNAEVAVAKRAKELEALATKVGDSPAPAGPAAPPAGEPSQPAAPAADAQQTAQDGASAGGAGDATDAAFQPAPGPAPAGMSGVAWKSN